MKSKHGDDFSLHTSSPLNANHLMSLQNYAFDAITESGSKLTVVSGPGEQGLQNLGNSCYMNSVVQALCALPEVASRYGKKSGEDVTEHRFFNGVAPTAAPTELLVQMAKLAIALTSGAYSIPKDQLDSDGPTDPKYRLAPRMFKHLIGNDHVDFKTAQQQDAAHFLQYLLEQLDRSEAKYDREMLNTSYLFSFKMEERLVCSADQKVKYKTGGAPESIWSLRLPMEKAETKEPEPKKLKQEDGEEEEKNEHQIPTLTFSQCVDSWAAETSLDDYRWPHLQNTISSATQTTRFQNFPRYLWVQAQRYQLGPDWQPIKLEVNLDIPESIDLSSYKSMGPQDGEDLVPEEVDEPSRTSSPGATQGPPQIDEAALSQLMDMGFNMNGCKRALMAVGGSDAESAMNWIFEHNMDPDFNDPLPEPSSSASAPATAKTDDSGVDDAVVTSLVESLGCFTIDQVRAALKETKGAADRAADWLFSHMDDLDSAIASLESKDDNYGSSGGGPASSNSKIPLEDGDGKYTMVGMISHIGKNTGSGHYVAHLKHDGKWVIYNDEKVALSEHPPIQHAYLYLFQRTDTVGSPNPHY
jgi:ubiquitin carboxyl-terminal hydrolase 5/13